MKPDHATALASPDAIDPDHSHLVDMADACDEGPTELQILDAVAEAFDLPRADLLERLIFANFMALRKVAT